MVSIEYLAGIIDGEGTIGINITQNQSIGTPRLHITNTNLNLLKTIQKQYGGKICSRGKNKHPEKWKEGFQLYWTLKDGLLKLLKQVYPYLIIKKEQCELSIFYIIGKESPESIKWHLIPKEIERRKWIMSLIKQLNKKGVTTIG